MARMQSIEPRSSTGMGRRWAPWLLLLALSSRSMFAQGPPAVIVNWSKKTPNRTTPTLQAVVNPMLRRGSPIHDASLAALRKLGCDCVRYAFWFPYPKLAVAELRVPEAS